MGFLPEGVKLSDLLPERLRELETFESFNILLDEAFLPYIDNVFGKALENIRISQDIDKTNFPLQLGALFGIPIVVAKNQDQLLPRLRAQVEILPYSFLHKGLQKSILLYLLSVGLNGKITEIPGQNAITLELFERYILDSYTTSYNPGFVFQNTFDNFLPVVENVKKLLPIWVKLSSFRFAGVDIIERVNVYDEIILPDIELLESLEWVSHRIEDRGILMRETNGFDLPNNIWDPPPNRGLIFDGSIMEYFNLPLTAYKTETYINAGLSGNTTASWTLEFPKIIETTFTFEIIDSGITYKGIDDGLGNIIDNGSIGGTVTGGAVDYLTGAVNITVSSAFTANVDAISTYRFESDYLTIV